MLFCFITKLICLTFGSYSHYSASLNKTENFPQTLALSLLYLEHYMMGSECGGHLSYYFHI